MFNKPKKSLGQNFLKSDKIAQEIVSSGEVCAEDMVLEVGPGEGMLTKELIKKAKKVIAVEKDERLAEFLKKKFAKEINDGKLEIISDDILKFNPSDYRLSDGGYKIIANIPYYITSYFLRIFLENDNQPSLMVLMVQKEVAERIAGAKQNFPRLTPREAGKLTSLRTDKEGNPTEVNFSSFSKESLLSISVKAYGEPKIIRKVPASYFSPSPKVDSAVLKISNISKKFFQDISEKKFFETVKKGFSQKRKMLINNLKTDKSVFTACSIAEKARAENVSLDQWKCLTLKIK
ncbi:MAG: rRNA adenine dimethyltransferase family protein [Patescibacteria group bacterium]